MLLMLLLALRSAASLVAPRPSSLLRAPARRAASLGDYFALPAEASAALAARGIEVAAPAQEAFWSSSHDGPGAAKGESACLHAPTGSGKTLAMLLPAHADVLGALAGEGAVASVTTSGVGAPGGLAARGAIVTSRCVAATPSELCAVLEHAPDLYGALNVEALVLDELDLLMPARKFGGKRASRWQDRGRHPAEALAQLVAKRGVETLQVVAGSATLDRASRKKLDAVLRASPLVRPPLRTVSLAPAGAVALTVKTSLPLGPKNVRTTLTSERLRHCAVSLPSKAGDAAALDAVVDALGALKPARALLFVCSSSGLKVRAVADALGARAAGETVVLNDALFPSSQRNRRRGYADADAAEKKRARERAMDSGGRDALSRAGAEELRAALGAATPAAPVVLVADQAVTRGLHVDAVDAVVVLGKPANADTYVHLAGRADRDPLREAGGERPAVLTVAKRRDVAALRGWLSELGADLEDVDLAPPPDRPDDGMNAKERRKAKRAAEREAAEAAAQV
ncbi:helicase [Aureococcus anophagefferens]|nr:helicase [Aureococcus anophagefferens]